MPLEKWAHLRHGRRVLNPVVINLVVINLVISNLVVNNPVVINLVVISDSIIASISADVHGMSTRLSFSNYARSTIHRAPPMYSICLFY